MMRTGSAAGTNIVDAYLLSLSGKICHFRTRMLKWVEFNRKYSEAWPVLVTKRDPLPEAEARDGETGKLEKYFSEAPGQGG